jgi:hypothetical protein
VVFSLHSLLRNGVNASVVKPVNFQEFIKVVKQLGVFWVRLNEPPPGSVNKSKEVNAAGEVN